jgi:hypothetical protein
MISPIAIYGSLPDVFGEPLVCVPGVFLQHCFYLLDTLGPLLMKDLVVMAAGSIWAGMFKPKRVGTARLIVTRNTNSPIWVIGITVYAITDTQGQGKRFWTMDMDGRNRQV